VCGFRLARVVLTLDEKTGGAGYPKSLAGRAVQIPELTDHPRHDCVRQRHAGCHCAQVLPLTISLLGVSARGLPRGCGCAVSRCYSTTAKAFAFCPRRRHNRHSSNGRLAPLHSVSTARAASRIALHTSTNAYAAAVLGFVLLASPEPLPRPCFCLSRFAGHESQAASCERSSMQGMMPTCMRSSPAGTTSRSTAQQGEVAPRRVVQRIAHRQQTSWSHAPSSPACRRSDRVATRAAGRDEQPAPAVIMGQRSPVITPRRGLLARKPYINIVVGSRRPHGAQCTGTGTRSSD